MRTLIQMLAATAVLTAGAVVEPQDLNLNTFVQEQEYADIAVFFERVEDWEEAMPGLEVPAGMWHPVFIADELIPLKENFDPGYTVRVVPVNGLLQSEDIHGDATWSEVDDCYYIRLDTGAFTISTFARWLLYHEWAHTMTYMLYPSCEDHGPHHAIEYGRIYQHMVDR